LVKRLLITTALEETWPGNPSVPVLFIGEWCRLYSRKERWSKMDALVAPYHWDDRKKLHQDYLYLAELYENLLSELAVKLNTVHEVDHSVRYWRIIVGPWLGYFMQMVYDRWFMLREAIQKHEIIEVRCIQRTADLCIPKDMEELVSIMVDDTWNETIYSQLLEFFKIPVEHVQQGKKTPIVPIRPSIVNSARKLKRVLMRGINFVSGPLCRQNEHFFISSYLPIWQDFRLQLKLGQVPKKWSSVPIPTTLVDPIARQWQWRENVNENDFSGIVRSMIPRHIPTAYLEGYKNVVGLTQKMSWPSQPKSIFTSNSHFSSDFFKVWAAAKVESGTPLVIGQHGGSYGMALWSFTEDHQIAISDQFLTWGWSDSSDKKVVPVGNIKNFHKRSAWDKSGNALLVGMTMPRTSYTIYSVPVAAGQWQSYFEDQCRFMRVLPLALRDQLLVRLYSQDYGHGQKERWHNSFPNIRLEHGAASMDSLIKQCRLYISTYNATTYLESMSLNIPTLIFWNPKHWELRDSAIPYFEKLKSAGIFHETPESAAQQMISIWDDVAVWWESEVVQSVRYEFCDRYARLPKKPISIMSRIFRAAAAAPVSCGARQKPVRPFSLAQ